MQRNNNIISCNQGATLIVTGLMFVVLLLSTALVVDVGRMYAVQAKAQSASDAALLGAVATISTNEGSEKDTSDSKVDSVTDEVNRFFEANYPANYLGSTVSRIVVTAGEGTYQADFNVTLPTIVMGYFGESSVSIEVSSQVTGGIPKELQEVFEVAMVLDNTGSMGVNDKISSLKLASRDLVNILFGPEETLENLHISVVPYDILVNIGVGRAEWIQAPSLAKYNGLVAGTVSSDKRSKGFAYNRQTDFHCGPYPGALSCKPAVTCAGFIPSCTSCVGFVPVCVTKPVCNPETGKCVNVKNCTTCTPGCTTCTPKPVTCVPTTHHTCTDNGLDDISDAPPTTANAKFRLPYENYLSESDTANLHGEGVDAHKWAQNLAPMSFAQNNKTAVLKSVSDMRISGFTRINVGLMWGWYTLSPKWQGLWDTSKPGFPRTQGDRINKFLVLMTDGKNVFNGDDKKTEDLCKAIKKQDIVIYTVGFGTGAELNSKLLEKCASKKTNYFEAPTEADLRRAFKVIGDDINYGTLRLSK